MVGKALKVDLNTLAHCNNRDTMVERGEFARVSVEVDLNKTLQSRFVIRRRIFNVAYEGLDIICFKCARYGHNQEDCSLKENNMGGGESSEKDSTKKASEMLDDVNKAKQPLFSVPETLTMEVYGEWMQAKRTFRQSPMKVEIERNQQAKSGMSNKSNVKAKKSTFATRYDVLQGEEMQVPSQDKKAPSKNKETTSEWRRKVDTATPLFKGVFSGSTHEKGESSKGKEMKSPKRDGLKKTTTKAIDSEVISQRITEKNPSQSNESPSPICRESVKEKKSPITKKRGLITRPKVKSPALKRKLALRAHQLVIGSVSSARSEESNPSDKKEHSGNMLRDETQVEQVQCLYNMVNTQKHKSLEDEMMSSPKKPPDPSTIFKQLNLEKEGNEANDMWFETIDDVIDEGQGNESVMEIFVNMQ